LDFADPEESAAPGTSIGEGVGTHTDEVVVGESAGLRKFLDDLGRQLNG